MASADDANYMVNFTMASYTEETISVQVEDFITELTQFPDSPIFSPDWGKIFHVNYFHRLLRHPSSQVSRRL